MRHALKVAHSVTALTEVHESAMAVDALSVWTIFALKAGPVAPEQENCSVCSSRLFSPATSGALGRAVASSDATTNIMIRNSRLRFGPTAREHSATNSRASEKRVGCKGPVPSVRGAAVLQDASAGSRAAPHSRAAGWTTPRMLKGAAQTKSRRALIKA